MRAQEYFEQVREAVLEIERSKEMLARMLASEGAKIQRYSEQQGNGNSDAMDRVNRRIEFEQRLQRRINEASEMLDEATALLYGDDDHGGLAKLKGNRYADVLCMAYCQAMAWHEVAEVMRCSQQWCRELSRAGFKYIDEAGFAKLKTA